MLSMLAGLMLQGLVQAERPPAPPAPAPPPAPPRRTLPAPPRANLGALITPDDYPAEAARKGEEGAVGFRLDVAANGRVTGCAITQSSGSPILDSATCRLLTARARFRPALDALGATVADRVPGRIVWRL